MGLPLKGRWESNSRALAVVRPAWLWPAGGQASLLAARGCVTCFGCGEGDLEEEGVSFELAGVALSSAITGRGPACKSRVLDLFLPLICDYEQQCGWLNEDAFCWRE